MDNTSRRLIVSKASAGSGKTFFLAFEYIKLLLGQQAENGKWSLASSNLGSRHRNILAVTFTNKATREMKERIVLRLNELTRGEGPYHDELLKLFGCSQQALADAAAKALHGLLFDFSHFNVSTLDSFFQSLLRAFITEVGQSGNYNIELDDKMVIENGVRMILQNIHSLDDNAHSSRIRKWIESYIRDAVRASKSWNIFKKYNDNFGGSNSIDLYGIAAFINSEQYKLNKKEITEYFHKNDGGNIEAYTKAVTAKLNELTESIAKAAEKVLQLVDSDTRVKMDKNHKKFLENASQGKADFAKKSKTLENFKKYAFSDDIEALFWALKDTKNAYAKNIASLNRLLDDINAQLKTISVAIASMIFYANISKYLYALGLLSDIIDNVEQYQRDNNTLLLGSTGEILRKVISDPGDAPFVYERTGLRLHHFLIDEFQDTSKLQWRNMKPLVDESLAKGKENLIIGDVKQSIYRFRNADSSLLHSELGKQLGSSITPHDLSTNYRSTPEVIRFNNAFIRSVVNTVSGELNDPLITETYIGMEQEESAQMKDEQGYVFLRLYEKNNNQPYATAVENTPLPDAPTDNDIAPTDGLDSKACRLHDMLSFIRDCLNRGYRQRDIGILVNTRRDGAEVVDFLISNADDIRIVSDESLLLEKCSSVQAIISMLSLFENMRLDDDRDEDAERKSSAYNKQRLNERHFFNVMMRFNKLVSEGVERSEALGAATTALPNDDDNSTGIDASNAVSLYELVEQLIATLPDDARKSHNIYLTALQDTVADYSKRHLPSIHAFLQWWNDNSNKLTVSLPADNDAVNVMTIHKAKGLEFECVILPFADWELVEDSFFVWAPPQDAPDGSRCQPEPPMLPIMLNRWVEGTAFETIRHENQIKEALDNLNKTYVAFTRAVRELYVLSEKSKATKPSLPVAIKNYILGNDNADEQAPIVYIAGEKPIRPTVDKDTDNAGIDDMDTYEIGKHRKAVFHLPDLEIDDARKHGTLLHKIMSYIATASDVTKAVEQAATKAMICADEQKTYIDDITRWISDPRVAPWFSADNRVITERVISIGAAEREDDNELPQRRPDCIVIAPDGSVTVIDYKFGESGSDSKSHSRYVKQIKRYVKLLNNSGFADVKGFVWYVTSGEICAVATE